MRSASEFGDVLEDGAPASWRRAGEVLSAAVELGPEERRAFVERACADDDALLRDVLSLLEAHERTGPLDRLGAALERARSADGPAERPARGERLGPYRILERIGGGGMGVVYRARDTRLERFVALKFLSPTLRSDPDWRARFRAEARAAGALDHPNICTIHEIGEAGDGRPFIAMPLYAGETIASLLREGALDPERVLGLALQICEGLVRAHDHGIVHRDIKPANLMVTDDGIVKILDFGVATVDRAREDWTAVLVGTAAYMSPEQARREVVDHRTDLWSLGVVIYEMLTGARPFEGDSWPELRAAILEAEPTPAATRRPGLPPGIDAILGRTLAANAADRYDSARELARELRTVKDGGTPSGRIERAGARTPRATVPVEGERRQATVLIAHAFPDDSVVAPPGPSGGSEGDPPVPDRACMGSAGTLARYRDRAARIVARHGGTVTRAEGGVVVAVFGVPTAHEDDTLRAVRAARELRRRGREADRSEDDAERGAEDLVRDGAVRLRLRSGIETGRVVARPSASGTSTVRVSGSAVRAARRLVRAADAGAILAGPRARRMVAPFFRTEPAPQLVLDADAEPVTPWRVGEPSGVETRLEAAERSGLTPFTGRRGELELLEARLDRAREGEGQFVSVAGGAGAGKSRLLHELVLRLEGRGTDVVRGRCRSYGGRVPYLPFRQALRQLLDLSTAERVDAQRERAVEALRRIGSELEDTVPLCLRLLSLPAGSHPLPDHLRGKHFRTAMLNAVATVFTLSALRRPTVLMLEDWHWADHASSEVLERLLELAPAYPILVVATHRPGHGIDWSGAPAHTPIRLRPLDVHAANEIARSVLGAESVPADLGRALNERAGGNPFFLEELCRELRENGSVAIENGRARAAEALDGSALPGTVQGVIRARLDRLDRGEREMLRVASVIGREFAVRVLARVLEDHHRLERWLERATALGLLHPVRVLPDPVYRFKHALTREVAYSSLLERQRRLLHGRVGRALETVRGEDVDEFLDALAHHFGQAGEWRRAAEYACRAAERAAGLSEFQEALALLDRARRWLAHLPPTDGAIRELTTEVLLRQERCCETIGLRARQQEIIDELFVRLDDRADRGRLADVFLRQGDLHTLGRRYDDAARSLARALRLSRDLGDVERERNTRRSIGLVRWHQGRDSAAIRQVERALAIDRARGDADAIAGDLANLGNVLRSRGESRRALECLEDALAFAERADNPVKQSYILHNIGNVHRTLGDDDEALRYFEAACGRTAEHRLVVPYSFHLTAIAHLLLRRGRVDESLRTYGEAVEIARGAKHADGLSQALRILGEVLYGLGRHAEALPHLRESAELFDRLGDPGAEASVRARVAAIREEDGDHGEALEAWARVRLIRREAGDAAGELEAARGTARALRGTGDVRAALEAYRDAAGLAGTLGRVEDEASLRNTLGILEWERGAYEAALNEYEVALDLLRRNGDDPAAGLVLNSIGVTLSSMGRHLDAAARLEAAVELNRRTGRRRWEAHGLAALADARIALGDRDAARSHLERSLMLRHEIGDRRGEGWMLHDLARLARAGGDETEFGRRAEEALRVATESDDARLLDACRRLERT